VDEVEAALAALEAAIRQPVPPVHETDASEADPDATDTPRGAGQSDIHQQMYADVEAQLGELERVLADGGDDADHRAVGSVRQVKDYKHGVVGLRRRGLFSLGAPLSRGAYRDDPTSVWSSRSQWMLRGIPWCDTALGKNGWSVLKRVQHVLDTFPTCWNFEVDAVNAAPGWFHLTPGLLRRMVVGGHEAEAHTVARTLASHVWSMLDSDWTHTHAGSRHPMEKQPCAPGFWIEDLVLYWNISLGWCIHCQEPMSFEVTMHQDPTWADLPEAERQRLKQELLKARGLVMSAQRRDGAIYHVVNNVIGLCHVKCQNFYNANDLRHWDPHRSACVGDLPSREPVDSPGGPQAHYDQNCQQLMQRSPPDISRYSRRGDANRKFKIYLDSINVAHNDTCPDCPRCQREAVFKASIAHLRP